MKKILLILLCMGCEEQKHCKCMEVINIYPQHATRAYADIKCENGRNETLSLHWSNNLDCNGQSYYAGDYIPGYGNKIFKQIKNN